MSIFFILFLLVTWSIFLSQVISAVRIFFSSSLRRHQHSDSYSNTGTTNVSYYMTLVVFEYIFSFHILLNFPAIVDANPFTCHSRSWSRNVHARCSCLIMQCLLYGIDGRLYACQRQRQPFYISITWRQCDALTSYATSHDLIHRAPYADKNSHRMLSIVTVMEKSVTRHYCQ